MRSPSKRSPLCSHRYLPGRFPRGYAHVDTNENAVFAADNGITIVLAVADGHIGFEAAREAMRVIADATPAAINDAPKSIVRWLAIAAIETVARKIPNLAPPRDASRTALTARVILPDSLVATTIGDTACFIARKRRVSSIGTATPFLSPTTNPAGIRIESVAVRPGGTVFVLSPGVVDFSRPLARILRTAVTQGPHSAVDTLIAAAFAGGAGDNIALAVARIG